MRWSPALAVTAALALAGCGSDTPELTVEQLGIALDGVSGAPPAYFTTPWCAEGGPQVVTIMSVTATGSGLGAAELEFAVDWPGGEDAEPRFCGPQLLPGAFEPTSGSTGTVPECGDDETADLAVLFPATDETSMEVERLEVDFEIDGDVGTAVGEVSFVQCGLSLTADADDGSCRDERGG